MYDRYLFGSVLVALGTMGCYLSKWRGCVYKCLTLALMGGGETRAAPAALSTTEPVDEERADSSTASGSSGRDETPLSAASSSSSSSRPAKRKKVMFAQPMSEEMYVPALRDIPKYVRDDMYWGTEDYAAIRDNQRRLIELVMRQVRAYPEGMVPPPIPGESRRGLGIICEPGTNSGRAARVRSARRAVVEAYRDGYSPEMIGKLASELSQWATKNAYDVGVKDEEAANPAGFDLDSFKLASSRLIRSEPSSESVISTSSRVARAARRSDQPQDDDSSSSPQQVDVDDGFGLAGMIRNDSLNNLASFQHHPPAPAPAPPPPPPESEPPQSDGMGLASMIRTDSLGNLHAFDVTPNSSSDDNLDYALDPDYSLDADYPVEAY